MKVGGYRAVVAHVLLGAAERVTDDTVPADQNDPAYWLWVFDNLPAVVRLLTSIPGLERE